MPIFNFKDIRQMAIFRHPKLAKKLARMCLTSNVKPTSKERIKKDSHETKKNYLAIACYKKMFSVL